MIGDEGDRKAGDIDEGANAVEGDGFFLVRGVGVNPESVEYMGAPIEAELDKTKLIPPTS